MTIKELYKILENCGEEHGWELPVVMAIDPEGNNYCDFDASQCVTLVRDGEDDLLTNIFAGKKKWKDSKNLPVCGVCLYPWNENYDSAEHACKGDENYDKI